jgi:hypothetical protein
MIHPIVDRAAQLTILFLVLTSLTSFTTLTTVMSITFLTATTLTTVWLFCIGILVDVLFSWATTNLTATCVLGRYCEELLWKILVIANEPRAPHDVVPFLEILGCFTNLVGTAQLLHAANKESIVEGRRDARGDSSMREQWCSDSCMVLRGRAA